MKKVWYVFPKGKSAEAMARAYFKAAGMMPSYMQGELVKKLLEASAEMAIPLELAKMLQRRIGGEIFPYEDSKNGKRQ